MEIDRRVLAEGNEIVNEATLTINQGETMIISTRKSLFKNNSGEKFIIGLIRDITPLKRVERDLKEKQKSLKALNTTKDQMFFIIAHDLKSPFHGITGLSDMLIKALSNSNYDAAKTYATLNNTSIKNTLGLVDNLLNWANSQIGNVSCVPKKVDLYHLIQRVVDVSKAAAQAKGVAIHTSLIQTEIHTDDNMFAVVLRNLITNAVKFTEKGGEIHITCSKLAKQVLVVVQDNGVGMPQEVVDQLFTSPTNTPTYGTQQEKGSGIGLALCNEFVQQLGGKIDVQSELGKGSKFSFTCSDLSSKL